MAETNELTSNFYYVDLQTITSGKPFAGFAVGEFVDMMGRVVEFGAEKLETFRSNTAKAIADNQAKGMTGLPIDARLHDKGEAAGWIVSVELGEVQDSNGRSVPVLMFLAEWTTLGVELISEKRMTNFSPTVDLAKETVRGGSLTNWPASVDANGIPLFSAIELSQGVHVLVANEPDEVGELEDEKGGIMTLELSQEQLDEMVNDRVVAALAALEDERPEPKGNSVDLAELVGLLGVNPDSVIDKQMQSVDQLAALVQQQAELKWQRKFADMQRQTRNAELAQRVTGGTVESPRGIPTDAEKLKAELSALTPEQSKYWGDLLQDIVRTGLTEYNELGHGKQTKQLAPVPDFAVNALKSALSNGATAEEFFVTAGLGVASDYDLSSFEGGK